MSKNKIMPPIAMHIKIQNVTIRQVLFGFSLSSLTGISATKVLSNSFGINPVPLHDGQGTLN
jgi:hypothetical protein